MKRKLGLDWTGKEMFNRFLVIAFPSDRIKILDFNRVFKTLNGMTKKELLDEIRTNFYVKRLGDLKSPPEQMKPKKRNHFSLLIEGEWFGLELKPELVPGYVTDPKEKLDV
jgi:uncharacterized protein (DUF1015 family)